MKVLPYRPADSLIGQYYRTVLQDSFIGQYYWTVLPDGLIG
jgi:hypothetical protein